MGSTLETLRSKLRSEIRIDPNDKIWSTSEKDGFLNDAYFHIQEQGHFDWPENEVPTATISTQAGVAEYDLEDDFILMTFIKSGSNNDLVQTTYEKVQRLGDTSQSAVSHYYIRGNKVGFWPTPSGGEAITYVYKGKLPDMTTAVNCSLPSTFDAAIAKYAAYLLFSTARGNESSAQAKLIEYDREFNRLFGSYLLRDTASLRFSQQRWTPQREAYPDRLFN